MTAELCLLLRFDSDFMWLCVCHAIWLSDAFVSNDKRTMNRRKKNRDTNRPGKTISLTDQNAYPFASDTQINGAKLNLHTKVICCCCCRLFWAIFFQIFFLNKIPCDKIEINKQHVFILTCCISIRRGEGQWSMICAFVFLFRLF